MNEGDSNLIEPLLPPPIKYTEKTINEIAAQAMEERKGSVDEIVDHEKNRQ